MLAVGQVSSSSVPSHPSPVLGQSAALVTNLKDPWGEAGRAGHGHQLSFGAGAPPLQGWGALVGTGTPGNQEHGSAGGQVAMPGGPDQRGCRGWGPPPQGQVARWVRRGTPHPQPWGGHRRHSPGTMEGGWPREAKGSVCPDSCCSFVTCRRAGGGRRR